MCDKYSNLMSWPYKVYGRLMAIVISYMHIKFDETPIYLS